MAKDADPSRMADFCIAMIQGAMLMGGVERSSESAKATVREALAHLKFYAGPSVGSPTVANRSSNVQ